MEYIVAVFLASAAITTYILSVLGLAVLIVQHKVEDVEKRYTVKTMVVPIMLSSVLMGILSILVIQLLEALA